MTSSLQPSQSEEFVCNLRHWWCCN